MDSSQQRDFKVGDWWARPQLKELRGVNVTARIETRSMEVLTCLARHAPRVVSKETMLSEVWEGAFVGDEVITHAVWELRRVFGDDPRNPRYIQTVAKTGYRLVADVTWSIGNGHPEVGAVMGPYEIVERLGQGAMGVVFKARDRRLGRSVALKFLAPELTRDEDAQRRFMREARLAAALDHPHLGTLHEIGETQEGRPYLVTPLYDGGSLKDRLAAGPVAIAEGTRIVCQIARGLAEMHRHGMIHRDVKPANVLLTRNGTAKLVDFGIAKLTDGSRLTRTGASLGTPSYKSPEQSRGEEVDHRTDIWSLGVVLFELLTGQTPFKGDFEQAVVRSILEQEPPTFKDAGLTVRAPLEGALRRALAKDPTRRFQSADALTRALETAQGTDEGSAQAPAAARHHRRPAIVLTCAVIMLVTVWGLSRRNVYQSPAPPPNSDERVPETLDISSPDLDASTADAAAAIARGSMYEWTGDTLTDLERAEGAYRSALKLAPGHPEALARLGLTLVRIHVQSPDEKLIQEAWELIRRAAEVDPEHWITWHAQAKLRFIDRQYAEAAQAAAEATRRVPADEADRDLAWALLGESLIQIGKSQEGLNALEKATHAERGRVRSRLVWANRLKELGDYSQAVVQYEAALRVDPRNLKALTNLGLLYVDRGRDHDALPLLKKAWELDSTEARMANNFGLVLFNLAYRGEDAYWPEVIDLFQRAIDLRPGYANAHIGLGDTYRVRGREADARREYSRALAAYDRYMESPDVAPRYAGPRAVCLAKLGLFPEAISAIRQLREAFPDLERLSFNAARVYALAGERERVYSYVQEAVAELRFHTPFYTDPCFGAYQDDSRFRAILTGAGLP